MADPGGAVGAGRPRPGRYGLSIRRRGLRRPAIAGAVLAGGRARRLGARSKACVELGGRPLLTYPLAALAESGLSRVAVVCKRTTVLPPLPEAVARWEEADEPTHPALGIAHALESWGGPVLVIATDMPWVGAGECRRLLAVAIGAGSAAATVAVADGRLQPTFALYRPAALDAMAAVARDGGSLAGAVEILRPAVCELPEAVLRGVNSPDELAAAERALNGAPAARSRRP